MIKKGFLLLAGIVCLWPVIAFPGAEDSRELRVLPVEASSGVHARRLRQIYPEIRANIEKTLGWKLRLSPTVMLVTDGEAFQRMSGNPLISALAVPARHLIVFHLSSTTSEPYTLRETFEHELCHLLLHEHIGDGRLPKWLDEGICQWISGSMGEILARGSMTTGLVGSGRQYIPLNQLESSFPNDSDSLIQAYAESRLFVEYLVARYGKAGLLSVLHQLREGASIEQAVSVATSKSLPDLEKEWLEGLQSRERWLVWVGQNLYELLFLLAAVLTVVAFVRLLVKKKRYDPDEEDDR